MPTGKLGGIIYIFFKRLFLHDNQFFPFNNLEYYMWAEVANGIIPFTKSSLNPPYNELYRAITGTNKPSR